MSDTTPTTNHGPTPSLDAPGLSQAAWASIGLLCAVLVVRTATLAAPIPWWDSNPLVIPPLMSGTGPGASMVLNALLLLAGALVLGTCPGRSIRGDKIDAVLLGLGAISVLLHGWVLGATLDAQWHGSTWLAALVGAVVVRRMPDGHPLRRVLFCCAGAVLAVLLLKGGFQILVEHPATVRDYGTNKDQILAARGWTPGSHMARTFERRLMQPDPTGWFALSNVLGSFLGAGLFMMGAIVVVRRQETTRPWLALAVLLTLACLIMLVISWAKGAIAATLLAGAVLAILAIVRRRDDGHEPRSLRLLPIACVLAGPALVLGQGLIGESLSNLSLLVRWFYSVGAVRIGLEHPIGVGPGGFQAAYLLARPPIATEEVASPHALFMEYWATLGILGLAWVALFLRWALAMGRPEPLANAGTPDEATEGAGVRTTLAALVVGLLLAIRAEVGVLTPEVAILWLVMLAVGLLAGLALWHATRAGPGLVVIRWGGLGAGLVMLSHAQVEVTGTHPSAAPLALALIGLAVPRGGADTNSSSAATEKRSRRPIGLTLLAIVGALASVIAALNAIQWERSLKDAAMDLEPVVLLQQRFQQSLGSQESQRALARELSEAIGGPVDPEPASLVLAIGTVRDGAIGNATESLDEAIGLVPSRWQVKRSLATLYLTRANTALAIGTDASADLGRAVTLWGPDGPGPSASAAELRAFATVLETRASLLDAPTDLAWAVEVLERVMTLDRYNLPVAMRLRNLHLELGNATASRDWAARSLELDGFKRLDAEVRGLSYGDRASLEAQLRGP